MKEKACQKLYNSITNINEIFIEEAQTKYRNKWIKIIYIVPILILCGFSCAAYVYWGTGSANHIHFDILTQPFGTIADDKETENQRKDTIWTKSDLIQNYDKIYADNAINYMLEDNNIPAIYFSPNYMVIFTHKNNCGWILNTGEELTLDFSLDTRQSLELEIGYVLNGTYYELSITKGGDFRNTIRAAQEGEYYFCITNHSSTNAVIIEGNILKE